MIEMLKRHEVQVLRRAGHTWKQIAALSGVSVRTVRRIAAESAITTIDNTAERARRAHVAGGGHADRRVRADGAARRRRSGGHDGR